MAFLWTRRCLAVATLFGAILSGITIDRYFVQRPAFEHLGAVAWGAYSRVADLGPNGLVLYPLIGIGYAVFTAAAAVSFGLSGGKPSKAALPVYGGVLLVIGGLAATLEAAPTMIGVAKLGEDAILLQQSFDQFFFWSAIRGTLQVIAFLANFWGLLSLYSTYAADIRQQL